MVRRDYPTPDCLCSPHAICLCGATALCYAEHMTIAPELSETPPGVLVHRTGKRYRPHVAATPRRTPQRTVAVEDEDWDELDAASRQAGYQRAMVIRAFIRWYLRRPGAKLPQRPGD